MRNSSTDTYVGAVGIFPHQILSLILACQTGQNSNSNMSSSARIRISWTTIRKNNMCWVLTGRAAEFNAQVLCQCSTFQYRQIMELLERRFSHKQHSCQSEPNLRGKDLLLVMSVHIVGAILPWRERL